MKNRNANYWQNKIAAYLDESGNCNTDTEDDESQELHHLGIDTVEPRGIGVDTDRL